MKVKEIKSELEKSLRESNKILLYSEKILQVSKNIEEKINNNKLKKFYYALEMNKKKEEMNNFIKKPKINFDLHFDSESNQILYEKYYFSGIPTPKDIKYEIKGSSLLLSWNKNEIRIVEPYYFVIKIKANNKESTYLSIFNNYLLNKFETNLEYEVKIRIYIEDYFSDWSEIKKFKIEDNSGNNKNIFLSSGLFNLKNDDNTNKQNFNIFGAPFSTKNNLDLSNNNKNDKQQNLINNSQEISIFNHFSNENKKGDLFDNNCNFKFSLFEEKEMKKSIFGDLDNKENSKNTLFTNNNSNKKLSLFSDESTDKGKDSK